MRTVYLTLEFEAAESLLHILNEGRVTGDMRDHLARAVESAIREASGPAGGDEKPRYVGEHGESDKK